MTQRVFELGPCRYVPGPRMTRGDNPGRIWTLWVRQDGAWVHTAMLFFPTASTRNQIRDHFAILRHEAAIVAQFAGVNQ